MDAMDTADSCPLSVRRSLAEVLWSLTATYVASLAAYGHLLHSLQGQKNVYRTLYQLLIFVIFPLYPLFSLVSSAIQASWEWQWRGRKNSTYCLSLISGLHVSRIKGSSEPLSFRHLWQGSFARMDDGKAVRIGRALVLIFVSCQCLGTLIRTCSRLEVRGYLWWFLFERFLPEDFECFCLCIGTMGVLIKSWLAFFLDTEWKSNYQVIVTADETLVSDAGIANAIAAFFYRPMFRTGLLFFLLIGTAYFISGYLPLLALFWGFIIPIALIWLIREDAEAIPNGLAIHMKGFWGCIASASPRAAFYTALSEHHYMRPISVPYGVPYGVGLPTFNQRGPEWYWVKGSVPWPLVLSITLCLLRLSYFKFLDSKPSRRSRVCSHLCLVAVNVLTMIVLPAFILTWTEMGIDWPVDTECPPFVLKDRFWTPSF